MPNPEILFEVSLKSLHAHIFAVRCTIKNSTEAVISFSIPSWTPGSYLIRDFAQHVLSLRAHDGTSPCKVSKINKDTWSCQNPGNDLVVEYEVYAFDSSIRACFLDDSYAFFSGTSLFLRFNNLESSPHHVLIRRPEFAAFDGFTLSTSLNAVDIDAHGYGSYIAQTYDELVDHPVLIANSTTASFEVDGIFHQLVVTPKLQFDLKRLVEDCKKICQEQMRFFDKPVPFSKYLFLLRVEEEGYGGLEHRSSSALLCKVADLPLAHETKMSDNYRALLGLFSHEYFHAWNVKQLKPAAFTTLDYNRENYTELLWFFEGATSYYDDLFLCRSKVIGPESYLDLLSRALSRVQSAKGRFKQTLAEASFDAWVKFYKPNENSHNATVSYYLKGSMVALALDLTIRLRSNNLCNLDNVMQRLWKKYGSKAIGVNESHIIEETSLAAQTDMSDFFRDYIHSTIDPPYGELLNRFGIEISKEPPTRTYLGCHIKREGERCRVLAVDEDSPAMKAGISAQDIVIALNGYRVDPTQFETQLNTFPNDSSIKVHVFRRGWLRELTVQLSSPPETKHILKRRDAITESERMLLTSWLQDSK